jgi:hypothetical protein
MFGNLGAGELLIILIIPAFWIWCLIDIMKSRFAPGNKVSWIVAVLIVPLVGSILYIIIGRKQKISDLIDNNIKFKR